MRILFDQGTPVPLRGALKQHQISTAYERGWSRLTNGDLLDMAEKENFEVLVTTDTNLKHQQNLGSRRIAMVVLSTTSWPRIRREVTAVAHAVDTAVPGSYTEVSISQSG